jgi:hypothetical protein
MMLESRCEQCDLIVKHDGPRGVPAFWTFILFCSIPCLTAWKRARYTAEAFKAS